MIEKVKECKIACLPESAIKLGVRSYYNVNQLNNKP